MFVHVIQGRTADPRGLRGEFERWIDEVATGAPGWLGGTVGTTGDGRVFALARYDSEADARTNVSRSEHAAWLRDAEKYFEGGIAFSGYGDVEVIGPGGSDDAGFVQVMRGTVADRARAQDLEARLMPRLMELRPDVLGMLRLWDGDTYLQVVYFASESEAREAERSEPPADAPELAELMSLTSDLTYLDLPDPLLRSA
jgi:hypothetical protein